MKPRSVPWAVGAVCAAMALAIPSAQADPSPAPSVSVPPGGSATPEPPVDAAAARYRIRRFTVAPDKTVGIGAPHRAEFTSEAGAPIGVTVPASEPLVVFLHGAHPTCYRRRTSTPSWPCEKGYRPIPSYRGYRYLSDALARRGIASVSISANGVNGQEDSFADGGTAARALLVARHLQAIARSAAGTADLYPRWFAEEVDLSRVMLVGHSRGAAGVARAAVRRLPVGTRIRAVMSLAGTTGVKQAVPGVPFVSLLPQCDGDVFDLEGQQFVDVGARIPGDRAARSAVWIPGGNHNFLNTQWTPGLSVARSWNDAAKMNDWPGPCQKGKRISSGQERRVARAYVTAAARLHLLGDPAPTATLDGSRNPTIAGVATRVTATGGASRLVERTWRGRVVTSRGVSARRGHGLALAESVGWNDVQTPHWLPALRFPALSTRQRAVMIAWERPGTARVRLGRPVDLRSSAGLRLRVATDNARWHAARGSVVVRDGHGTTAQVPVRRRTLVKLGSRTPRSLWAQSVTVPVAAIQRDAPGLDLSDVRWIGWAATRGRGRLLLLDAWSLREPRAATPRVVQVEATGSARWTGSGYRVRLAMTTATPAAHHTRVRSYLSGYDTEFRSVRGSVVIRAGETRAATSVSVPAHKRDHRLVVAPYPDRWGLNLSDYVWLPVR
ncbi:MAG: hypothetical protein U0R64_04975 [Candidatus Nanopelagicales bacterium]